MEAFDPDLILALARQQAGPFYLYDVARLRHACRAFQALPWAPLRVCFATMANAHPTFLTVVREEGLGVFVNTVGHLDAVLGAGFAAGQVTFAASGMSEDAMRRVRRAGVAVNLDSMGQVARWRALFPGQSFGLRCDVGGRVEARRTRAGFFLGPESRLGLGEEELHALGGASDVAGLHLYAGTDILDLGYFEACYDALCGFAGLFPAITHLDLGGGFGVPGPGERAFDLDAYGALVRGTMERASAAAGRRLTLVLEPGRIVGAEAAVFVCRVSDVKRRAGRQLVGVEASSAQFPRPLLYPDSARHPVRVLPADGRPLDGARPSRVFGCSTYSRDFLAHEADLPEVRPGDLLIFGQAGAYCASLHTRFLGFPPAAEIFQ